MSTLLFDVFVVGATDASPAGQSRLAATLAARHGAPEALVAKAIAAKNLRVGSNLEKAQADVLDQQLKALGAVTSLRPADAATAARPPTAVPGAGSFAPPTVANPTMAGATRLGNTLPSLPTIASPNPFAPPATMPGGPRTMIGGDPFAPPQAEGERGLELDGESHSSSGFRSGASTGGASAQMLAKMIVTDSNSGLAVQDGNPFIVRCPIHELEYDKRKAHECRKCAAERATGAKASGKRQKSGPRLRDNPVRRAFLGLAFALFVGAVPAAYNALQLGEAEVQRLRARQQELSQKPGTEEVIKEFDGLDVAVDQARSRSMFHTLILWVLVSSGGLAIWYRVT